MKIIGILFIQILFILTFDMQAQVIGVGINTRFPKGAFHIDAAGDNPTAESTPLSVAQARNDVVMDVNGNLAIGGLPAASNSVILRLLDPNKAMQMNKVPLTNVEDAMTIPSPTNGLLIHNTTVNPDLVNPLEAGAYYYVHPLWRKVSRVVFDNSIIQQYDLMAATVSKPSNTALAAEATAESGANMVFGLGGDPAKTTITFDQDGSYMFALRLYGSTTDNVGYNRFRGRIYLYNASNPVGSRILDYSLVEMPTFPYGHPITATVILQGSFKVGDNVQFRLVHFDSNPASPTTPAWSLRVNPGNMNAAKSTMVVWKV